MSDRKLPATLVPPETSRGRRPEKQAAVTLAKKSRLVEVSFNQIFLHYRPHVTSRHFSPSVPCASSSSK